MKVGWIITEQVSYVFIQVQKNKVKSKAVSVFVMNWKNKIKLILEYQIPFSKLISKQCHSHLQLHEYGCFKLCMWLFQSKAEGPVCPWEFSPLCSVCLETLRHLGTGRQIQNLFVPCLAATPQILVALSEDLRKQTFYSKAVILLMLVVIS